MKMAEMGMSGRGEGVPPSWADRGGKGGPARGDWSGLAC